MKGAFSRDPLKLEAFSAKANCAWNENGLRTTLALDLGQEGNLEIRLTAAEPVQRPPSVRELSATWKGIAHTLLSPLFPPKLLLRGQSSGQASGQRFPDGQVEAGGEVKTTRTEVVWQEEAKPLACHPPKADLNFTWQGESLRGGVSANYCGPRFAERHFSFPLAARLHPSFHSLEARWPSPSRGNCRRKGSWPPVIRSGSPRAGGNVDLTLAPGAHGISRNSKKELSGLRIRQFVFPAGGEIADGRRPRPSALGGFLRIRGSGMGGQGPAVLLGFEIPEHGTVEGQIVSSESARLALPKAGQLEISWTALDVGLLSPWGRKSSSWKAQPRVRSKGTGCLKGGWRRKGN